MRVGFRLYSIDSILWHRKIPIRRFAECMLCCGTHLTRSRHARIEILGFSRHICDMLSRRSNPFTLTFVCRKIGARSQLYDKIGEARKSIRQKAAAA